MWGGVTLKEEGLKGYQRFEDSVLKRQGVTVVLGGGSDTGPQNAQCTLLCSFFQALVQISYFVLCGHNEIKCISLSTDFWDQTSS